MSTYILLSLPRFLLIFARLLQQFSPHSRFIYTVFEPTTQFISTGALALGPIGWEFSWSIFPEVYSVYVNVSQQKRKVKGLHDYKLKLKINCEVGKTYSLYSK